MTNAKTSPTPRRSAQRRWLRRGVSLIEVVMAAVLLAVVASSVVGGVATVVAGDARNQQKLEALELGNRLLLQYLDDKKSMPPEASHLQQGRGIYRWELRTSPVAINLSDASLVEKPAEGPGAKAINKLSLISISVYAGVPDGMGGYTQGERVCTLSRVCHPLSVIYRNPDSTARITRDPTTLIEWMTALMDDAPASTQSTRTHTSSDAFTGTRSTSASRK